MAEHEIIHTLFVDDALTSIENMVQALRGADFVVTPAHCDQIGDVSNLLDGRPADLIIARVAGHLPTVGDIRAVVDQAFRDIPILAGVDQLEATQNLGLLRAGAHAVFPLGDLEYLALIAQRTLGNLSVRRQVRRLDSMYKAAEERCRVLLDSSRDAIAYIHDGAHVYANQSYLDLFGYGSVDDLAALTLVSLVPREDRDRMKAFLKRGARGELDSDPTKFTAVRSNGETVPVQMTGVQTNFDGEACLQVLVRDLSKQAELQQQIKELAKRDMLTGMFNRMAFMEQFDAIHRRCQQSGTQGGGVIFMLLPDYRKIREEHGLAVVDQVITGVAEVMRGLTGARDLLARYSDPVFVVYTPDTALSNVKALAEALRDAVAQLTVHVEQRFMTTTACIGLCMLGENHTSAAEVVNEADAACELARQKGGNQVVVYTPPRADSGQVEADETLLAVVREAISNQRLSMMFQPIATFQGAPLERYQIHLAITREDGTDANVEAIIPVAERRGLMGILDKWAITHAIELVAERLQAGTRTQLLVRLSRNSITDIAFPKWLGSRLSAAGVPPELVAVEMVEAVVEENFTTIRSLRDAIRALGVPIILAQYGATTFSERLVRQLEPDYVKLSSEVMERLGKGEAERKQVVELTELARSLEATIIAANVQSAPQLASLWQYRVSLVQGDVVQPPSPVMDFDFAQFAG